MQIRSVGPHRVEAVSSTGEVLATARRSGPGNLWYVTLERHRKGRLSRNETPHARISGKLPEPVQQRLVQAALSAAISE